MSPVVRTSPYDDLNYILNLARALINDSALASSGNLLANSRPYTITYANAAWRTLQTELTNSGVETYAEEEWLLLFPLATPLDPATQVYISFTGSYDGTLMHVNPVLPPNMVGPLRLWERPVSSLSNPTVMGMCNDGLPRRAQTLSLCEWEWRGDKIWMVGATQVIDLKLRFNKFLPDFRSIDLLPEPLFSEQLVPMLRCDRAFACFIAAQFASARGSPLAQSFTAQGLQFIKGMTAQTSRRSQRGQHRRIGYGRASNSGWGY